MGFNFPSSPSVGAIYSPGTGVSYQWDGVGWRTLVPAVGPEIDHIQSTVEDMRAGFKTTGLFTVNTKADGSGTDLLTVDKAGAINAYTTFLMRGGASFCLNGAVAAPNGSGLLAFQNSAGTRKAYVYVNSAGHLEMAAEGGGNMILTSISGAMSISSAGAIGLSGGSGGFNIINSTMYNTTGSNATHRFSYAGLGTQYGIACYNGSSSGTAMELKTSSGNCGGISVSGTTTAFQTTSDERLKTFTEEVDGDWAVGIIRANPVKKYTWNDDPTNLGEQIGWGAQTSYAVDKRLALPPRPETPDGNDAKSPSDNPWTIDYGRRTPFLWAALAKALDRIDELEARLAALEGAS